MDKEKIEYIIKYYSDCLGKDNLAIKCMYSYLEKGDLNSGMVLQTNGILKESGWISGNQTFEYLVKDGRDAFEFSITQRILSKYENKVFFNYCPECGKRARTPYAKQCRYCLYDWHDRG
ncbi:hypothetical protein GGR21_002786 [Dysgonomonas hofstadii]|uniref:Uncharacterized protein n=1 Tax=Dysgonomonas hofstadii TaxID=637886 RepID=A0A840CY74_9BACT|nr:hypothetical protein [Dysgonomonas hofstadii]MBB4036873.1 hypothetical protein [Dysgonomonas hofstadii]